MVQGLAFLSKKSWHTKNLANQEKVWIAQERKKAEESKTKELARQIQQEREQEELDKIAGKKSTTDRGIDWMYHGQSASSEIAKADAEKKNDEYLLGKEFAPEKPIGKGKSEEPVAAPVAAVTKQHVEQESKPAAATNDYYGPASSAPLALADHQLEGSVAERNEAFRLRVEDPMFEVTQRELEKKRSYQKKKELYEKVTGSKAVDAATAHANEAASRPGGEDHDVADEEDGRRSRKRSRKMDKKKHKKKKRHRKSKKHHHRRRGRDYSSEDDDDEDRSYYSSSSVDDSRNRGGGRSRHHHYEGDGSRHRRHDERDRHCRRHSRSPSYDDTSDRRRHRRNRRSCSRSPTTDHDYDDRNGNRRSSRRSRSPSPSRRSRSPGRYGRRHYPRDIRSASRSRSRSIDRGSRSRYVGGDNNQHHSRRPLTHGNNNDRENNSSRERAGAGGRYSGRGGGGGSSRSFEGGGGRYNRDDDGCDDHRVSRKPPPPEYGHSNVGSSYNGDDGMKKPGYGLQGSGGSAPSISSAGNKRDLGPDRELLQRKREEKESSRRQLHEAGTKRRRKNAEDRAAALREMERDARTRREEVKVLHKQADSSAYATGADDDDADGNGKVGGRSFLNDLSRQTHGVDGDTGVSMSERLRQNRHTHQQSHEAFL